MGTSGGGRCVRPEFLMRLECFFFRSSILRTPPLSPSSPPILWALIIPLCALLPCSGSPSWAMRRRWRLWGRTQERQRESARVRARAREGGAVMSDVARPRWSLRPGPSSFLSPGEPGSGGGGAAAVAERAGLVDPHTRQRVWGWGRGVGTGGLGSLAWTGRGGHGLGRVAGEVPEAGSGVL